MGDNNISCLNHRVLRKRLCYEGRNFYSFYAIFKYYLVANTHSKMTDECVFTTNECAFMKNTYSKMPDECVFMTNECALMKNIHSKMPDECVFLRFES